MNNREKYIFSKAERERPQLLKIRPEVSVDEFSLHGSDTGRTMRLESSVKQKNMELSRRIEQSPNDIDAWLGLIEHQNTLLRAGDDRRRITNAEIKSTADIKIHMYEKALDKDTLLTRPYEDVREIFLSRIRSLKTTINAAPGWIQVKALYEQTFWCTSTVRRVWEAEVPRIGETSSLGWKNFAETGDDSTVPEPQADEPETSLSGQDLFRSWAIAEASRIGASRVPARTMDDTVEDDPYRVILFTDIENFLILLPKSAEYLRRSLLNAFLIFCHLPSMPTQDQESSIDLSYDSCLYNEILDYDSDFKPWREVYGSKDNGPVPYFWVRNTLKQLTNTYPMDDLAEYYLAFEWTNEPSTIKKVAKALIKQHSSSFKLYNAYAMIEWSKGNQEISNSIYTAALGMSKSISSDNNDKKDSIYLWKSLIWANISTGLKETALSHLLSIPNGIPSPDISVELTPTTLLKAQQYLSSTRDHFLTVNNATYAVLYTELFALFKYLTTTSTTAPQSPQQGNIYLPSKSSLPSPHSSLPA
ncbi:hypothetical protein DID88_006600 [Monilinia fructigena]|uniref:Uncharacterized protein n=1 Tax=Monilinia fructigena TaxID=38457 RepID=A0A395IGL4_9HELO|nr:hypothetical protein DID88_006600 [Monilinia fructigena]